MELSDRVRAALAESGMSAQRVELIEAAWDDCLDALLEGTGAPVVPAGGVRVAAQATGVSLDWIEAEGFRGIARGDRLTVPQGPGLTLVLGRNGSGKSSYVEALEVALRGQSARWENRTSKDWERGWANLHHPADTPVSVRVGFVVDDQGAQVLERRWESASAPVTESQAHVGHTTLDALGWPQAMAATPPILSYAELGRLADAKPSELHDALERLLGLEDLHAARDRLNQARARNEKPLRDLKKTALPALKRTLQASQDPRAETALAAISTRTWDLDALDALALGLDPKPEQQALRALAQVQGPKLQPELAGALRDAHAAVQTLGKTHQAASERVAQALKAALHAHTPGDADCVVCGRPLPDGWARDAQSRLDQARQATLDLKAARRTLDGLIRDAQRALKTRMPPALGELAALDLPTDAVECWQKCHTAAAGGPLELAVAIETLGPVLDAHLVQVRNLADARRNTLEEQWAPARRQLGRFATDARRALAQHAHVADLKAAKKWVVELTDVVRQERFTPISDCAIRIWAQLRQTSSVSLNAVQLAGTATKRRLDLDTCVDDTPANALGVMSQGEINALGLALFVPRAISESSPFRFLVIDDPVQAMDPHKVDGLALVLHELAADRQVVVFTHDPRLREALDRMQLGCHVLEVRREPNSVVKVQPVHSPVRQYLLDARRVAYAEAHLGPRVVEGLVPAHCRSAIEAACTLVIRRRRIAAGVPHADVEALIRETRNLVSLLALALFDNENMGNKVFPRVERLGGPDLVTALKAARQSHGSTAWSGTWKQLISDTERLTDAIRSAK
jgi:DNA repair exonuclease SbcCD ATPase subunit